MNRRAMIALAASAALLPATAMAQTAVAAADPGPATAGYPAYGGHGGGMGGQMHHSGGGSMHGQMGMQHNFPPPQMHHGGHVRTGRGFTTYNRGGFNHYGSGGGHHSQFQRINRGGIIPPTWFGGQFQINNWGRYGFSQPFEGGRWVRYYDDALLIDREGRVHDGRYGLDWDRYGDRWSYGEDGVPGYYDDEEGDDREWAEEDEEVRGDYRRGDRYDDDDRADVERRVYVRRGPPPGPPPRRGPAYGCGCGYNWVPVMITETTVTTTPAVETRTVYETVTEHVRVAPRVRHRVIRRAPPPPRPGERG